MNFDWKKFCDSRSIAYVTTGKNVSGNRIAIRCPLCGASDPSQHMVLSLDKRRPYWSCWRNPEHKGNNPTFLVSKLAHVPMYQAREIVGEDQAVFDSDWDIAVARLRGVYHEPAQQRRPNFAMPKGVRQLRDEFGSKPFLEYMVRRGFDDIHLLCKDVELYYARFGDYAFRLIFPVRSSGKLVAIIGRDITGKHELRYKATPDSEAAADLGTVMYNQDAAEHGGRILWPCEGPIDSLKLHWYGSSKDNSVCFFGMVKRGHIRTLSTLTSRHDLTMLALDNDAMGKAISLSSQLPGVVRTAFLPRGVKDVGAMSPKQVSDLVKQGRSHLTASVAARTA